MRQNTLQSYWRPDNLEEVLDLLARYGDQARIIAGGTDVLIEFQRGIKATSVLIDITAVQNLKYLQYKDTMLALGALTTHNDILLSSECRQYALPLVQACWEVGVPQIRTRATVAGNLITASPANDTITPLMALDARLVLTSCTGERVVPLRDFYTGVRRTVCKPNELLREIRIPALQSNQRAIFLKLGLRQAQAVSVINLAIVLTFEDGYVRDAKITLGCLAPTIIHASSAEEYLIGKRLDAAACSEVGLLASRDVHPIDDIRATAAYRSTTLAALLTQGLQRIAAGTEREGLPVEPVVLEDSPGIQREEGAGSADLIETQINGKPYQLVNAQHKTLLNALREDAGLTGTKEGCAEGECGACTVWLNGQAVMACLVPAPQAHEARITTIEGLADGLQLHPLQQAFIDCAAVQCGFCIPGMLMAGAKLLQEQPQPDIEQIRVALSGNICRCTGYRKIIDAVLSVGGQA